MHLEIPSVDIDTDVTEGGIITNKQGQLEWQTVPFIAVQYRETALVGARGNAVISGHVVTIAEGNVFRNLYKVNVGDAVGVETAEGRYHLHRGRGQAGEAERRRGDGADRPRRS